MEDCINNFKILHLTGQVWIEYHARVVVEGRDSKSSSRFRSQGNPLDCRLVYTLGLREKYGEETFRVSFPFIQTEGGGST